MKAIRISLITASITTALLGCFYLYQYFISGNQKFINGINDSGLAIILYSLALTFFFIIGLISFLPSLVALYSQRAIKNKITPLVISCGSILVCFGILYYLLLPTIESLRISAG